jgi:hypothetical protein
LFYTRIDAFKEPYALERIIETLKLFKDKKKEIIEISKNESKPIDANETRKIRPPTNDKDYLTLDTTPSFIVEISIVT